MKVLCITDHELLPDEHITDMAYKNWKKSFLYSVRAMSALKPEAVILREKLLSGIDYTDLFTAVKKQESPHGTHLIWHDHYEALTLFMKYHPKSEWPDAVFFSRREAGGLSIINLRHMKLRFGLTVHDVNELADAKTEHTPYILASNIFETSCKPGVKPKGLHFLKEVCTEFHNPVYALGGITPENASSCLEAGAAGVAVRSLCMADDLHELGQLIEM